MPRKPAKTQAGSPPGPGTGSGAGSGGTGALSLPPPPSGGALHVSTPASEALTGYLSANTKRAYERDFKDFFGVEDLSALSLDRILTVSPRDVQAFRDRLMAQKLSPATVQRKLSAIRSLYNYLMARGAVMVNPAHPKLVRAPKKSSIRRTDALTWEETVRFLAAIDRKTPQGRRDYALFLLCANCGFRRAEILSLRYPEDLRKGPGGEPVFIVRGKGEKTRKVAYGRQDLVEALAAYLADRGTAPGYLFHGREGPHAPLDSSWLYRLTHQYAEKAGLLQKIGLQEATGKARWRLHPHSLRAGYIYFALEKGVPVNRIRDQVGHSRDETTLGYVRDYQTVNADVVNALAGLNAEAKAKTAPEEEEEEEEEEKLRKPPDADAPLAVKPRTK